MMLKLPAITPSESAKHLGEVVKVVGKATPKGELKSPCSDKPVVAYSINVRHSCEPVCLAN